VFTKNRDRLLDGDIAAKFFRSVLRQAPIRALLSDEHFSVDGTLIEAWASMKSFRPKDPTGHDEPPASGGRNAERDFHSAPTTAMPRPPTPMRACSAKAAARRPGSVIWAIC